MTMPTTKKLTKTTGTQVDAMYFTFGDIEDRTECGMHFEHVTNFNGRSHNWGRGRVTLANARRIWRDAIREGYTVAPVA